jgi:hypothetical protein
MSALRSGCTSEISIRLESGHRPSELGAFVGRAHFAPGSFGIDTAESEKCVKKCPLPSPPIGGKGGGIICRIIMGERDGAFESLYALYMC